jgi:hypothetical protein
MVMGGGERPSANGWISLANAPSVPCLEGGLLGMFHFPAKHSDDRIERHRRPRAAGHSASCSFPSRGTLLPAWRLATVRRQRG